MEEGGTKPGAEKAFSSKVSATKTYREFQDVIGESRDITQFRDPKAVFIWDDTKAHGILGCS